MPPNLALFLAIVFILFLFISDSKPKPVVFSALWVPLIWYMLVASRSIASWFDASISSQEGINYLTGNPIDRIVYVILIVIGILILLRRKVDWLQIIRNNAVIFLLFFYMGVSILWSDFPFLSFKRWIRSVGAVVMVLVVLTDPNPLESISTLLRRFFFIHIPLSIILIKYFRSLGVTWGAWEGRAIWVGLARSKNVIGQVAMTCGIYSIWNIMRTWRSNKVLIDLIFLLMSIWLLKGSRDTTSMTSILVFLFSIILLSGLHTLRSNVKYVKQYMAIGIFLTAFSLLTFQLAAQAFEQKSLLAATVETSGRDMTFTGRTELWTDILEIASHRPIFGAGYGSFWVGDMAHNLWEKHIWKPGQGHNGYIDVYVELGWVGVFLLIGVIFSAYKNITRTFAFNFEYARFRMTFLTMILLNNITESTFLRGTHNLWFLFLLAVVNIPKISQFYQSKSI